LIKVWIEQSIGHNNVIFIYLLVLVYFDFLCHKIAKLADQPTSLNHLLYFFCPTAAGTSYDSKKDYVMKLLPESGLSSILGVNQVISQQSASQGLISLTPSTIIQSIRELFEVSFAGLFTSYKSVILVLPRRGK